MHFLALEGLAGSAIVELLDAAERYREAASGRAPRLAILNGRTIANLFFEDSTRTRCSFTLAARRLGADTIDLATAGSSVSKGETLVDTALNIQAMGVDAIVVRCNASGGAALIAEHVRVPVINAGDGRHEHPTQGLTDLMTLRQRLSPRGLRGKTVAIVGDIANSRVARSALHGLTTLEANVILVGPPTLVPKSFEKIAKGPGKVSVKYDLDEVLGEVDAIMMLRVQFERSSAPGVSNAPGSAPISGDYKALYGLSSARAAKLPPHAVVLHPGPINRGLEIDDQVADDPKRSVILEQVTNGVAVRMTVLARALAPA
jgi:aspartate carbamoyltransferase catalytic subunit